MVTLIVAMDEERLIGRGDQLPWRLPGELKLFRDVTMGNTLIMGRKTWLTLPGHDERPRLDGRVNFVVTRRPSEWAKQVGGKQHPVEGPHFVDTIELAFSQGRRNFPEFAGKFFIMGGRQIYELALRRNLVDRLRITHVPGKHIGDVYLPPIGPEWTPTAEQNHEHFRIVDYRKS